MKSNNIFKNIPKQLSEEIFEDIISQDGVKIERIISKGQSTPKGEWYDQDTNEWVIIMKSKAVISFEDSDDVKLGLGDYLNIPAHTKHRVSSTDESQETIWLAVHY